MLPSNFVIQSNMFPYIIQLILLTTVQESQLATNLSNKYNLFEITAFNDKERAVLYRMHVTNDCVHFLNGVTNIVSYPMHVLVDYTCVQHFQTIMDHNDIEYIRIYKDSELEEYFKTKPSKSHTEEKPMKLNRDFLDWNEIMLWVKHKLNKNTQIRKIIIGRTYEDRELFVLKISSQEGSKPKVFILGGEQGRDKISVAVILKLIDNILLGNLTHLVNVYDFYFMPVFNPDGYEFSSKKDLLFNKNRKSFYPEKTCTANNFSAVGVNIDRNWFFSNSLFVEDEECLSVFLGHESLSEEEPSALANFLNSIALQLMAFINLRGFSSLITVPYAQPNLFANNYAVLSEILLHASKAAFKNYNVSYNMCSTHKCFYNHTGNAPDWVKKHLNVPIVFTVYLKQAGSFLPHINQVPKLLCHLTTIIRETLLLAFDIYVPLFNHSQCLLRVTAFYPLLLQTLFVKMI